MSNQGEKKGMSAIDFFCIGFGAIVGVGWAVSINGWMSSCGTKLKNALELKNSAISLKHVEFAEEENSENGETE